MWKSLKRWWLLRRIKSRNETIADLKDLLVDCRQSWKPEIAAHVSNLLAENGKDQKRIARL